MSYQNHAAFGPLVFGPEKVFVTGYGQTYGVSGPINNLYVQPYADNNVVSVSGDVRGSVTNYDAWGTDLNVNGYIWGDLDVSYSRGGEFSAWAANDVDLEYSSNIDLSFGSVGHLDIQGSHHNDVDIGVLLGGSSNGIDNSIDIGRLREEFELANGNSQTLSVSYADGALIHVDDEKDFFVDVHGGDVAVSVENSTGTVVTGWGDDGFIFTNSKIAYKPGTGNDTVEIDGGRTVGNGADGDADTFIFNVNSGGSHDLFVDKMDVVMLQLQVSGLWDADQLQEISHGSDATVQLGNFELELHVADHFEIYDDFGGKG